MLSLINLDEAAYRARLDEIDDEEGFSEFDPDIAWTFDLTLCALTEAINEVLNTGNAALAGGRSNPLYPDNPPMAPSERIDLCLLADPDGCIAGYIWTYDLSGARSLSIATGFSEWKDLRGESDGIDGCVEIAHSIVAYVNRAITEFNEFVGGAK